MLLDGVVVWGGILDTPRYRQRPVPQLDIIALGTTLHATAARVGRGASHPQSIGSIAKLVGDAIGISTTTYLTGGKITRPLAGRHRPGRT